MWNLPRPGTESMSPSLVGIFLSSAPRGKSQELILWVQFLFVSPKSTKILHSVACSSWPAESCLKKKYAWLPISPLHQNLIYTDLPTTTSLEQFLRVIWNAVLILPQTNLTCNFLLCIFFFFFGQHKKGKRSRRAKTIWKNVVRVFSFKLHHKTVDVTSEFCRGMNFWGLHLYMGTWI